MGHLRVNIYLFKKYLGFLIAFSLLFFLGRTLISNWNALENHSWHFHSASGIQSNLPWLLSSFTLFFLYSFLLVKPFLAFLRQLGIQLPYHQAFQIFYLSKLCRYLPGNIGLLLGQLYFCQKAGISKTEALLSCAFELGFLNLSGILISLCTFPLINRLNLPFTGNILWVTPIFLIAFFAGTFILAGFGKQSRTAFTALEHFGGTRFSKCCTRASPEKY